MESKADLEAAARGDREAFDRLATPLMAPLRSYILRTVTNAADSDDILQEVLLKAHGGLKKFRGDSSFKTWIFAIAYRACVDLLRHRKRWRVETQPECEHVMQANPEWLERAMAINALPDFVFSIREHIAFCFSCVSRILEPEQQATVLLREVFGFSNNESAKILGLSESVFRHHLADARKTMMAAFDHLCALINKQGVCYQCHQLRDATPPEKQGQPLETIGPAGASPDELLEARLDLVRDADLAQGSSNKLHALFFELMGQHEESSGN